MKLSGLNLYDVRFTSKETSKKEKSQDLSDNDLKDSSQQSSKKVVLTLSALAVVGAAAFAISRGKGKVVSGNSGSVKPINTPVHTPDTSSDTENSLSKEAEEALEKVKKVFGQETEVSPETIDRNILVSTSEQNPDLARLNRYFEHAEERSDRLIEKNNALKNSIRQRLSNPTEPDAQLGNKIDNRTKTMSDDVRAEMTDFYTQMAREADEKALALKKIEEANQAKKEAMLKLKEENPEEYHRLKVERNKAQRLAKQERKAKAIQTVPSYNDFHDGTVKIYPTENGNIEREYIDATGKLSSEIRYEKDKIIRTSYNNFGKFSFIYDKKSGTTTMKRYEIGEKGKYKLVSREIDNPTTSTTISVEHMKDGLTQITKENPDIRIIVVKDKKGKIISTETIDKSNPPTKPDSPDAPAAKLLAPWYKHYLSLCEKFHVAPRPCGVKGGAGDHYYELCLRINDPDGYRSYVSIRNYRARYNEKAQLLEVLDKLDNGGFRVPLSDSEVLQIQNLIKSGEVPDSLLKFLEKLISETESYNANIASQSQQVLVYA